MLSCPDEINLSHSAEVSSHSLLLLKTSLIKASAQHTGRHIANVPLAKISTNTELMSIFFDRKFSVPGQDVAVTMSFKDIIFVIEDVDACTVARSFIGGMVRRLPMSS